MDEKQDGDGLLSEALLPLNQASLEILNQPLNQLERRVHIATIHRWAKKGCRGHILETCLVGGRRYTSCEAIRRFLHATNSWTASSPPLMNTREKATRRKC